jgi:hypothetical protein
MSDRRNFLKTLGAIAAGLTLSKLTPSVRETDADRFECLMRAGPVTGQRFVIDRPIHWPPSFDVTNCHFDLASGRAMPLLPAHVVDRAPGQFRRFQYNVIDGSALYGYEDRTCLFGFAPDARGGYTINGVRYGPPA